jgi:CBS domain-containing protein
MIEEPIPTAGDLMTHEFLAVLPTLSLVEAVIALERDRAHTAFVVDGHERLIGLLTEKDCLRALGARCYDEAGPHTVGEVMVEPPATEITPRTDAYAITQAFLETPAGMLPVVDAGKLVGGVSQLAVLRALLGVLRQRAELLANGEQVRQDLEDRPTSIERMQKVFADWSPDQIASLLGRHKRH